MGTSLGRPLAARRAGVVPGSRENVPAPREPSDVAESRSSRAFVWNGIVNQSLSTRMLSLGNKAALRSIAVYELVKACIVVAAGIASLFLLRHDLAGAATHALRHLHLDPASRVSLEILHMALRVQDFDPRWIALGCVGYALVRVAESYGLWFGLAWGEWIGALSGAIYLPIEIHELITRVTALRLEVFLANLAIVSFLAWRPWRRRAEEQSAGAGESLAERGALDPLVPTPPTQAEVMASQPETRS